MLHPIFIISLLWLLIFFSVCFLYNSYFLFSRRLSENRKPTAEKPFLPHFPIIFVKEPRYSPQMNKKSDSKWLSLVTASILGQPPIDLAFLIKRQFVQFKLEFRQNFRLSHVKFLRKLSFMEVFVSEISFLKSMHSFPA